MMRGVQRRDTNAGTLATLNQVIHGFEITTPTSLASLRHSKFCAADVRRIAPEAPEHCHQRKHKPPLN